MRTAFSHFLRILVLIVLAGLLALAVTGRSADPVLFPVPPGAQAVPVIVVDHGYHSGFVFARTDLEALAEGASLSPLIEITDRFRAYPWLEIGWGDEGFYRGAPQLDLAGLRTVVRALFASRNASVMHIVGLANEPHQVFSQSHPVDIALSLAGATRLAQYISDTFARTPDGHVLDLGPGLYGPSLFYRARPAYRVTRTCNHWVAIGLHRAGLGVSLFAGTLSWSLRQDLAWRSGLGGQGPIGPETRQSSH